MNLRRIKHTLLRLSAEEKVIGIGSLLIVIGCFLPWYSVVMNFDNKTISETGFSGDLGVIGFVIFIMSLMSLTFLVAENMHLPIPQFGYKRENILFFLLGQSAFLTLLTLAVYTKRSLEFTDAGLRFGIYLVLLGALFGALSAFALIQKDKRKEVQEFFSHEEEAEKEALEAAMSEESRAEMHHEAHEEPAPEPEPEPEMFFEEDVPPAEEENPAQEISEYVPEDDMIEDVQEIDKAEEPAEEMPGPREEEGEQTRSSGPSMNFYDDR